MTDCMPTNKFKRANRDRAISCGCGEAFADRSAFREHNLLDHEGQYLAGSSHFLSKFTRVVLPANTKHTKMYHQEALLLNGDEVVDVHTERKLKERQGLVFGSVEQQFLENEEQIDNTLPQQQFRPNFSDTAKDELENARLVRNPMHTGPFWFYCGNCKKNNFENSTQFIIHCREVCKDNHKKSSHFLTLRDIRKEIEEYQMKQNYQSKQIKGLIRTKKGLLGKKMGPTVDHSDLLFECGVCSQIFQAGKAYYLHAIGRRHSETIDSTSSHIVLRLKNNRYIYVSDRVQWIRDEEIYYCPCNRQKKMEMAKLIKHVRRVHMGISPLYDEKRLCNSLKVSEDDRVFTKKKEQEVNVNEQFEKDKQSSQLNLLASGKEPGKELDKIETHQILRDNDTYLDNLKTANELKDHTNQKIRLKTFMQDVLGITHDHSDRPFGCRACKMMFLKGQEFCNHLNTVHQGTAELTSSHVVVRIRLSSIINIYLRSDRMTYIYDNDDIISYCPCKPSKKMSVAQLIRHIKKMHWGISPIYEVK